MIATPKAFSRKVKFIAIFLDQLAIEMTIFIGNYNKHLKERQLIIHLQCHDWLYRSLKMTHPLVWHSESGFKEA